MTARVRSVITMVGGVTPTLRQRTGVAPHTGKRSATMDTDSGGHYRDTGAGPELLTELLPPLVGRGEDTPERAAYRAYLDHVTPCQECHTRVSGCDEGKRLWAEYKKLHPLQEWIGRRDTAPTAPGGPA